MDKVENWENLLREYVESIKPTEFIYGKVDCVNFTNNALKLITNKDFLNNWNYSSLLEYKKELKRRNYSNIAEAVTDTLKREPQPATKAKYGDVVATYLPEAKDYMIGICMGARAYFLDKEKIVKVPLEYCNLSWSI